MTRREIPCDELMRAMLYHTRLGETKSAIHCAFRLAHKGNARAVWKELILFTYSHVGLVNLSFSRVIFRQYYKWFLANGKETPAAVEPTVYYVTAIMMCCNTVKNRIAAECSSAYLLGATGKLLPEDWSVQLCTTYYINMCLGPILENREDAITQSCIIFGRAVSEKREDIACRHLDLLLGFGQCFLAWDILFSVVCHSEESHKYLDTVGETLVHWLMLTETVNEETDLFVLMEDLERNWFVRGGHKKRLSMDQELVECLDNLVCGAQFVPVHDDHCDCYNSVSRRFSGADVSQARHVRSRPLMFQTVLMLVRNMPFAVTDVDTGSMHVSVERDHAELAELYSTPVITIPNDAIDVYTKRGRETLNRGLTHLLRQENLYSNGHFLYEGFSKNISKGYEAEESCFGPHTEVDLFMRKLEWYSLGVAENKPS